MKPREKILKYWPTKLESWELIATILWSWIKWLDVFKLSKNTNKIIEKRAWNIVLEDLEKIRGIWKVKAIQIISAFELAKRFFIKDIIIIESVFDILDQVKEYRNKKQEYLLCITIDWANRLLNTRVITIWLLNQSLVHPREVFADAIEDRANSIIIVHNHPSWTIKPSLEDKIITNRIKEVSKIVWIKLVDHVIITKDNHFSFCENNIL